MFPVAFGGGGSRKNSWTNGNNNNGFPIMMMPGNFGNQGGGRNNNFRRNNYNNNNNNSGGNNRLGAPEDSVNKITGYMEQQVSAAQEAENQRRQDEMRKQDREYQEAQMLALWEGMQTLVASATKESEKRTQDVIKNLAGRIHKLPRPAVHRHETASSSSSSG